MLPDLLPATQPFDLPREAAAEYFSILDGLLRVTELKTSQGPMRIARASEFMMMNIDPKGSISFKHRYTRNYLFLILQPCEHYNRWTLYVPVKDEPFMQGDFDSY